jgi:hypothetical protein
MKKITIKNFILLASLTLAIVSCKKDDEPTPAPTFTEESFVDGYLNSTGFNQKTTNQVNFGDYEFGIEFKPLVKGKITSLLVKLPDVRTNLKVTIWDKAATSILRTEVVNVAAANTAYTFDIADLDLVKDKEYAITMNSNDWYDREKTDGSNATYPVTSGNIQILAYKWLGGTTQTYPTNNSADYYAGDCTFKFVQTN